MGKKLCIFHGEGCSDGFGAAYVVHKSIGEPVEFHPGVYQDDPPDVTGRDVILVDFSYKRDVLVEMAKTANSIFILDHHKSAAEDLKDFTSDGKVGWRHEELPGTTLCHIDAIFDMERSGAMMAWQYFFPDASPPWLIKTIQDRDLWLFDLPNTKVISMALRSYPQEFSVWEKFMTNEGVARLAEEGAHINRFYRQKVEELKPNAQRGVIGGYSVPIINAPAFMASDLAGELAVGEPFAAVFWETGNNLVYSLRSSKDGIDVSKVAKTYGGGGHKHAAGFKIPLNETEWPLR